MSACDHASVTAERALSTLPWRSEEPEEPQDDGNVAGSSMLASA
jgi:hypothetical protein